MIEIIGLLIVCHLVGDFLLQNHWMQTKTTNSFVCTVHVGCYSLTFIIAALLGLIPWWIVPVILIQHWIQDRFSIHVKWMKFYAQTPPDKWPVGPLFMDQSMHIGFMAFVCILGSFL